VTGRSFPQRETETVFFIFIEQHLNSLFSPSSWATRVDVVAAASLFHIPIYYCTKKNGTHKWNVVKALTDKHAKPQVIWPQLTPLDDTVELQRPEHFELLYFTNSHYDATVSATTGRVCDDQPVKLIPLSLKLSINFVNADAPIKTIMNDFQLLRM